MNGRFDILDHLAKKWAPPDHNVFKLVPDGFAHLATHLMGTVNMPGMKLETVWQSYTILLEAFQQRAEQPLLQAIQAGQFQVPDDHYDLVPGLPHPRQRYLDIFDAEGSDEGNGAFLTAEFTDEEGSDDGNGAFLTAEFTDEEGSDSDD